MVTGYFSFFDILPVTEFEIQTVLTERETEMLINELEKAINDSVTDWKDYLKADAKVACRILSVHWPFM
jgi:hypothetical protein